MMTRRSVTRSSRAATLGLLLTAGPAWGQQAPAVAPTAPATARSERAELSTPDKGTAEAILAIDAEYSQKFKGLEVERLAKLQALAAGLSPKEAAPVYEQLFRSAIASDVFAEVEPAADAAIRAQLPSPTVRVLAHLVKLIAESDRGDFEQSLKDLSTLMAKKAEAHAEGTLSTAEVLGLADAYYQRLVHAGRYDVATRAFQLLATQAEHPEVKGYLASRLNRLNLIGKPAPAIQGTDIDGRSFDLAALRGKVVLVVFGATWSLPSAAEVAWLQQTFDADHGLGFEIVGVNLDPLQDEKASVESFIPNVRRFALDYNLRWPILMNRPGAGDIARAYGVTEIPASVLIDREGKIVGLDLVRKNLEPTVSKLVKP